MPLLVEEEALAFAGARLTRFWKRKNCRQENLVEITAPDVRNVGTMVLELLLLLLKLTFILRIVSSVFFQVEVGGVYPRCGYNIQGRQ